MPSGESEAMDSVIINHEYMRKILHAYGSGECDEAEIENRKFNIQNGAQSGKKKRGGGWIGKSRIEGAKSEIHPFKIAEFRRED